MKKCRWIIHTINYTLQYKGKFSNIIRSEYNPSNIAKYEYYYNSNKI